MGDAPPVFLILLFSFSVAILAVPKEKILVTIIVAMCFLPADISIKISNLDFTALRILAILSLAKVYFSPDRIPLKINQIDIFFFLYHIIGAINYVIASENLLGAVIYKSGVAVDSIVLYTVFRYIIHSKDNLRLIIKTFQICVIILLPFAIFEYFSAINLFSIVGRDHISMRAGEIRTACTFSHPILFGSFAAAIIPILCANYIDEKHPLTLVSIFCCLFFVFASASSGPLVGLAGALFFLAFYKWKEHGSKLAWGMLTAAVAIHVLREQPIWHFIFVRISLKSSSTGYHRYMLVNAAVNEFWDWWLFGYGDLEAQWHLKYWPYTHATFTDVTNHYLLEGVRGGFLTMLLFIILCYKVIKTLGSFSISQKGEADKWLFWGFMVMMITHCISFLSVAYFGQMTMLLFLTIAIAAYAYNEMSGVVLLQDIPRPRSKFSMLFRPKDSRTTRQQLAERRRSLAQKRSEAKSKKAQIIAERRQRAKKRNEEIMAQKLAKRRRAIKKRDDGESKVSKKIAERRRRLKKRD